MYIDILNIWKNEIENINVNGVTRKVSSIDFFPMQSKYYPHSSAWKANFNFEDAIRDVNIGPIKNNGMWEIELNKHFILKFGGKYKEGPNSGELQFNNSLCEYMTYQGHRFIIQFYPDQFVYILRDRKLRELGI